MDWARRYLDYLKATNQITPVGAVITDASFQNFISHLATKMRVASNTQNQAFCALLFLLRETGSRGSGEHRPGQAWTAPANRSVGGGSAPAVRPDVRHLAVNGRADLRRRPTGVGVRNKPSLLAVKVNNQFPLAILQTQQFYMVFPISCACFMASLALISPIFHAPVP